MKIKVKKLHPDAIIPKYATDGASGFDLVALENIVIEAGATRIVRTGIAIELPKGVELQVRPRSGLSLKTSLRVANSPGTVDSDYRGECCVIITNIATQGIHLIQKGDRIAQAVICPVIRVEIEEATDLSDTERGEGGFGSTGLQ